MLKAVFYPMIQVCFLVSGRHFDGYAAMDTNARNGISNAHENLTTGTGNHTLDTGLESNVSQTCSRKMKPRDLCIIKETVAIIEPEIEESESQNQPAIEMLKKNNSQPNLQVILSMPYGSFLGHESPNVMSKSQPNLQVTVSMSDCTFGDNCTFGDTSVNEKSTSTSDLELNEFIDDDDTWSSCSAGTNSSCGSSFREDCPHCLIQSKSSDSFDENVMEVFV